MRTAAALTLVGPPPSEVTMSLQAFSEIKSSRPLRGWRATLCTLLLTSLSVPAHAQLVPEVGEQALEVHGFVSQGFIKTTNNNYLAKSERGSFEFVEAGVNFTKPLSDQLRVGLQLFARDLGPTGNYRPQFDWFYFDYRVADWFGIRAGRTKLPFGLYNETSDIDAARVPVLLPQSVYPQANRDFLLAQTGAEIYGYVPLGDAGAFDYRVYGGTLFLDETTLSTPDAKLNEIEVPYLIGARAMWLTPLEGLQVGASFQALSLNFDMRFDATGVAALQQQGLAPMDFDGRLLLKYPIQLGVASLEYTAHDLQVAAEFSRWRVDANLTPQIIPNLHTTQTRWYAMASYRLAPWFTPGIYYSFFDKGAPGDSPDTYQRDLAVSFRYDITSHWIAKLEGHYMNGTGDLNQTLNPPPSGVMASTWLGSLPRSWGVLLLKATASF